jgi:superfamily II DNA helicase RecQ
VCGIILGGITLTIVPLLSLKADQTLKVNLRVLTDRLTAGAFHLDELSPSKFEKLHSLIADLGPSGTMKSIVLFSSPQALLKPSGHRLLDLLFERKILRFIAVDEVHLFIHFAMAVIPVRVQEGSKAGAIQQGSCYTK